MNTPRFAALTTVAAAFALLPGCYTQLATYGDEESSSHTYYEADEDTSAYLPDSLSTDDSLAIPYEAPEVAEYGDRPWYPYGYSYPGWYAYDDPYAWGYWDYTVIYPRPWWWTPPWYTFFGWHYSYYPYRSYAYGHTPWRFRDDAGTTRSSGVRRSGSTTRRDYDPGRSSGTTRPDAGVTGTTVDRGSTSRPTSVAGSTRTAPPARTQPAGTSRGSRTRTTQKPSRSWSVPDLFRRPSDSSTDSRESRSSSGGRTEQSRPSSPAVSAPAPSPAPSRSSSGSSSSGARDGGSTRSSGSSRGRNR